MQTPDDQIREQLLDEIIAGIPAADPPPDAVRTSLRNVSEHIARMAAHQDAAQPPVRLVPDVPTDPADGASCETRPIEQPPGRRHVSRRFVAMFKRRVVHGWLVKVVAAGIALFAGTLFFLFGKPVSAADALRGVMQANDAYSGWVHVILKRTGDGQESPERFVHFNTADQTIAIIDGQAQMRRVQFFSPATGTWSSYDGQRIVLGDLSDVRLIREQAGDLSLTWPEVRERLASAMEEAGMLVKQSRNQALDRFEVLVTPKNQRGGNPTQVALSVWADRETKLVQMISASTAEPDRREIATATYRYGEPAVPDIYAAGAPKEAPVVDKRTADNAATLVKRIREATQADAGDYVAILTRSRMKNGVLRMDGGMTLELLVKRGKSAAKHVYSVGTRDRHAAGWMHVIPAPDGWPEPDFQSILKTIGQYNPRQGTLLDGTTITSYAPDPERGCFSKRLQREIELDHAWECMLPTHVFGASLSAYTVGEPGTTFQWLPMHKDHMGLQGLRVSIEHPMPEKPSRLEADIWCDPTKGFVPVEFVVQSARDGETPTMVERHVFTQFAALGSGRSCPRVWQETIARSGETYECHLIVSHDSAVDETWLSLPKYLPDQPH